MKRKYDLEMFLGDVWLKFILVKGTVPKAVMADSTVKRNVYILSCN